LHLLSLPGEPLLGHLHSSPPDLLQGGSSVRLSMTPS
jgi:hypothetical protein